MMWEDLMQGCTLLLGRDIEIQKDVLSMWTLIVCAVHHAKKREINFLHPFLVYGIQL